MKKIAIILVTTIIILLLFTNSYLQIEYGVNLIEFFSNTNELTAEELNWIEDNSPLIYAADNNAPPLRFMDDFNDSYQGVAVDYVRALSIELGVEIVTKPLVWNDALTQLEAGHTDLCDMYPSDEREERFIFSEPIYYQRGILVSKDQSIHDVTDLESTTVAIQRGDFIEEYLNNHVETIKYVYTNDYEESLILLANNEVDATAGDEPVMSYFIDQLGIKDSLVIADEPLYEKPSILAMPKDQKMLQKIINKGIRRLEKKNTMEDIQQKWFGISTPIVQNNSMNLLRLLIQFILFVLIIVLIAFYYFNVEMKKRIDQGIHEIDQIKNELETTFDSMSHYLILINFKNEIININQSFANYFELTKDQMMNTSLAKFDFFNDQEIKDIIQASYQAQETLKKEVHFDEQIFEISSFILTSETDQPKRVLLVIEDVTETRIQDKKMIHSNKMVALGQLAAGITHEIRNPLGIIRHNLYLVKNKFYEDEKALQMIFNDMDDAVDSANNFIDNLLNFSRISDDSVHQIMLRSLIEETIVIKRKHLNSKNIEVDLTCHEEIICYFNKESLKHIFLNLLNNAIDAIGSTGKITIKCIAKAETVSIIFEDDGAGIQKKHLDQIFKPFFTTKYPDKGTGLGLNIVYKELEKFGGDIKVESEQHEYTRFTIDIPNRGDR